MPNTVLIHVVLKNGVDLVSCPASFHFPCVTGQVDGQTWYINSNAAQTGWEMPTTTAPVAPAVGFEVGRVVVAGVEMFFAGQHVPSSENLGKALAELCNACCSSGSPPEEFEIVLGNTYIPSLYATAFGIPDENCETGDCTYTYNDLLPATGSFTVTFNCEGTRSTTTSQTLGSVLSYVQGTAPFSTYGTWTLTGRNLKVTGTSCSVGALTHT